MRPRPVPVACADCGARYDVVRRFTWCPHRRRWPWWARLARLDRR